ncbi:MAG: glutamate--cysteine ligase [Nitrospinae bacterium]|nr:glutamate--cysteine ligase [Nitrospinota bacterium]
MSAARRPRLFDGVGVEVEFMIVDARSLDVLPIADELLERAGEPDGGPAAWSNELAMHLVEIKTVGPMASLAESARLIGDEARRFNHLLRPRGARLMPTAAHPWMDPATETLLWPYEFGEVYRAYDRVFDCRTHGYANLQSVHVNLPFEGDAEFGALMAAARLVVPLIPALAASSPIYGLARHEWLDGRLAMYLANSGPVPSITGALIPEPIYTEEEYRERVLEPMLRDMAPFDQEEVLRGEWLNARAAIARFDRGAVEIRVVDTQERPRADMAVAAAIAIAIRAVAEERWIGYETQRAWDTQRLRAVMLETARYAETAVITDRDYLRAFGASGASPLTAGALWEHVLNDTRAVYPFEQELEEPLEIILRHGSLASRILRGVGGHLDKEGVFRVYRRLCDCLERDEPYLP